jgi:hypothetical protein
MDGCNGIRVVGVIFIVLIIIVGCITIGMQRGLFDSPPDGAQWKVSYLNLSGHFVSVYCQTRPLIQDGYVEFTDVDGVTRIEHMRNCKIIKCRWE